jgi:hypothetical protein
LIDGLSRCGFCSIGASPPTLGEREQLGSGIGRVRLLRDVAVGNKVFDELGRSLLGDPEVLRYVGRSRVTSTDPHKRESVGGANISEPAASKALLHTVDELAGQAQNIRGRVPAPFCHGYILTSFRQPACL